VNQSEYLEVLFIDCGFSLAQRKDWLRRNFGPEHVSDMKAHQRSAAIDMLKGIKANRRESEYYAQRVEEEDS
jgi:hypothetical protein